MQPLSGFRLFLTEVGEPCIRLGGWIAALFGRDRISSEMRLRGLVLGGDQWRIGRRVELCGPARRFRFGARVTLYGSAWLDASGAEGFVELGDDVSIDRMSVLYGQGGLSIGARCAIASGVVIYSQSNQDLKKDGTPVSLQPVRYAAVTIGDGCWLGAGAIVLPGVTVGRGASIGAGAVVRNEVPANALAVGVPAIAKAKAPAVSGVGS